MGGPGVAEPLGDADGRRAVAERMADAAGTWLDALSADQLAVARATAPRDDDSDTERRAWFYTPTDHGGLTLHMQRPAQQQAAMRLVSTGLSIPAYVTVAVILGLENVLDQVEGFGGRSGRERGRDPGLYYLRVFGEPGRSRTWGWRFGGHHVSLNYLVADDEVVATTPSFLGANPAGSPLLAGGLHRPLGRLEDLARELVRSLDPDLADQAALSARAPSDLVTGNRPRLPGPGADRLVHESADLSDPDDRRVAYSSAPKGLPAAALDSAQRRLLRGLLRGYVGRVPEELSPTARYDDDKALDAVHFAWAGSTEPGRPHYYRLQGPRLLAEWDNTQRNADHAHSVWRDPTADFGVDVLARHRCRHHPG